MSGDAFDAYLTADSGRGVQCALCGEYLTSITEKHAAKHGLTVETYKEKYGPTSPGELKAHLQTTFPKKDLAKLAIEHLDPDDWAAVLADSGMRIFSTEARAATLNAAYTLVQMRIDLFQKSATLMGTVLDEMNKPWRTKMDENGRPLMLKELYKIGELAQADIKNATDAILRLTYSVVQDNKGIIGKESQGEQRAFSGEVDRASIPGEINGHMREQLRLLIDNLDKVKRGEFKLKEKVIDGKSPESDNGEKA